MKLLISILIIAGLIGMVGICYSQDDMFDENLRTFDGKVVSVDIGGSTLKVAGAAETVTFPISPDTKFDSDIFDIELSDLKTGNYVTVGYLVQPGKNTVKTLRVTVDYNK